MWWRTARARCLFENDNLMRLAEQSCSALRRKKAEMSRGSTVCWCAVREFFEEKVEPVLAEPMESITHFASRHWPARAIASRSSQSGRFAARALPVRAGRSIFGGIRNQGWRSRINVRVRRWRRPGAAPPRMRQDRRKTVRSPSENQSACLPPRAPPTGAQGPRALPEWNLADLYPGHRPPAELKRDLEWTEAGVRRLREGLQGQPRKARDLARGRPRLADAVRRYEKIDDVAGRLSSYAGLLHAGDAADPALSKFYGDMQERITAAYLHLLFFTLELNRIDDAVLEKAMADPALGLYRPWIEDIRRDKPYQLEDRVEQLFHEKSMTGYSAFNRLFDETMVGLRFKVAGKTLSDRADAQSVAEPEGSARARRPPRRWPRPSRKICGCSRWSPTRSPRTRRFPTAGAASPTSPPRAIFPTASSRRSWMRWSRRCAPPIRSSRIATTR